MIVAAPASHDPPPATPVAHLVSLSAVTWNFGLVGRTRMLTEAWLREEQPTTFVQAPSLRNAAEKLIPWRAAPAHVVRPWPTYPSRLWGMLPESTLRRGIGVPARALERRLDREIDWSRSVALVISPLWAPWLASLPFQRVVYDCIDDVSVHVPRPRLSTLFRRWEDELLERADAVVVTAATLGEELHRRRPSLPLRLIRNAVDPDEFRIRAASTPRPVDLPAPGARPIIGFVGALYDWIDWKLISAVVRRVTDCDFIFVGPDNGNLSIGRLSELPNVRFLGARPYQEVPAYMQAFDVCWVPFDHGPASRAANPVKIYEYLALGKPVVTTPVADTAAFGETVRVAADDAEMTQRLREALDDRGPAAAASRRSFADRNSWASRAAEYAQFAAELLDRSSASVEALARHASR